MLSSTLLSSPWEARISPRYTFLSFPATGLDGRQELDMVESTAPTNGSFHCQCQQRTGKCDVCKIVLKTRSVLLSHFGVKHSIAGCNTHLPATKIQKNQWFVYLEECIHPEGTYQYIGSTDSMTRCTVLHC